MKFGLLTSVDIRHRYFARRMYGRFSVSAIAYEKTGYAHANLVDDLTPDERVVVNNHFAERKRQEQLFFGLNCQWVEDSASCRVRHLEPGTLNTDDTLNFFMDQQVEALAVFGTNLIRNPLLKHFSGRLINLHLGLSPYYRGTATNFYPLLNEEPQFVGATIHLLDAGIDSGPILRHARPEIVSSDRPHTLGCKAIERGIQAMIEVVQEFQTRKLTPVLQWEQKNSKLYLRKDYHPRQVIEMYQKFERGLISNYLSRAKELEQGLRLINDSSSVSTGGKDQFGCGSTNRSTSSFSSQVKMSPD